MTIRLSKLIMAAALAALSMSAPTVSAAQDHVIMSNDNNAVGLKGKTFEVLRTEIEDRLGDKVKVELHHSGALFDQNTQVQGLQLGSADLIAPTSGHYAPIAPKVNALSLPFLLSSPEQIQAAMDDPVVREAIFTDMEAKNVTPVAVWMNGPRDLGYTGDKPILTPADMKGIKVRVQSIPVDIAAMEAAGANVVAMSWSEVPTAMQQGVIDAVEPTPNALVGAGLHEMVDHVTKIGYYYSFYIVGANKQWWEGLPENTRAGLQEALAATTAWNWENARASNAAAYETMAKQGVVIHELSKEGRAAWVAAMEPVWAKFGEETLGKEAMDRLRAINRGESR